MNANDTVDILAVGPHPDDVEMGCGGTLVKMKNAGYRIGVVDLTAGENGTRGSEDIRAAEAEKASEILGLDERVNLRMPDGRVWNTDDNRESVVRTIRRFRPKLLIMSHWFDDHPDHVQGAELVRDAWYMSGFGSMFTDLPAYRPDALLFYMVRREFDPTFIVDISGEFERKMAAVRAYASQFFSEESDEPETPLSQPDFLDMFEVRAKYYGRLIGKKFGEPFFCSRPPAVNDPVALMSLFSG